MYAYALPRRSFRLCLEASRGPCRSRYFPLRYRCRHRFFYLRWCTRGWWRANLWIEQQRYHLWKAWVAFGAFLASSTPATTFNPLAAVARPAHVSPAAPHPNSVDPLLRCTLWPRGTDGLPDAERCARGNSLNDGFQYFYNRNRGTSRAVCGRNAACTCCRRPFEH